MARCYICNFIHHRTGLTNLHVVSATGVDDEQNGHRMWHVIEHLQHVPFGERYRGTYKNIFETHIPTLSPVPEYYLLSSCEVADSTGSDPSPCNHI